MNIGEAASQTGLPAKTIRYYEDIDLVRPARRNNGFRHYGERAIHDLRFVARARSLGFSIEVCRQLLALYRDKERPSSSVREAATTHITGIRQKISDLKSIERTLSQLIDRCAGDARPECPILDKLSLKGPER